MNCDDTKGKRGIRNVVRKASYVVATMYGYLLAYTPTIVFADKESKKNSTDTGVKEVTEGIGVIKDLVLGCVGGVGVIFLAWGLLDFGTAYADRNTTEQSSAIKKVVGGLIMVAVPTILKLLGAT